MRMTSLIRIAEYETAQRMVCVVLESIREHGERPTGPYLRSD